MTAEHEGTEAAGRWEKVRRVWEIIDSLRGEPGCPWDKKQTPESVQTYLIEEAHEAAAAVRSGVVHEAAEELGDMLFMVFFLVHLYEERGDFKLEEVSELICEKMVRRHPHVFGDVSVESTQEVLANWEKIKKEEKAAKGAPEGDGVPESLPALVRAYRMISRLSHKEGSGWNEAEKRAGAFAEMAQELAEKMKGDAPVSSGEFGEVLTELVNLARLKGLRPEDCLHERLRSLK